MGRLRPFILVHYSAAIWKVTHVRTYQDKVIALADFESDMIDVQLFKIQWIYGNRNSPYVRLWKPWFEMTPLTDMEIIALSATESLPAHTLSEDPQEPETSCVDL